MASAGGFDPYLKWLGIHPKDQPPHHYRLLGIDTFESDPDVISNAADARMAQIRTYQAGRYSSLSQQILNEIAAAKVALLSGQKKAEYDEQLRARLAPRVLPRAAPAPARSLGPPPLPQADPASDASAGAPGRIGLALSASARDWRLWTAVASMAALLAVAGGVAVLRTTGGGDETLVAEQSPVLEDLDSAVDEGPAGPGAEPEHPGAEPEGPGKGEPEGPAGQQKPDVAAKPEPGTEPTPTEKPDATAKPEPGTEPTPAEKPDMAAKPEPGTEPTPAEKPDMASKPDATSKPDAPRAEGPAEVAVEPVRKVPVPDAQSQQAAEATIRELFKSDFASLKAPAERLALADKLFQQGLATQDDSAAQFVLFRLACDLASGAGEVPRTLDAIDEIAKRFEVDALAMKARVLEKAVVATRNVPPGSPVSHELAENLLRLTDEAVAGDQWELASQLAKLALPAARKAGDPELKREAVTRGRLFGRLQQQFASVEKALSQLQSSPDDPEANLTVGRWYCFTKGQWEKGLPYLAKCEQAEIKPLAEMDLAGPTEPNNQVVLAEAWSKYARTEEDDAAPQIKLRAGHWLKQALPSLTGLQKRNAENQLEAIDKVTPLIKPRVRGEVRPGNVALAANGTTIAGPNATAEYLIDGNSTDYALNKDTTHGVCPCQWTITLDKVYSLREIRLLLFDRDRKLTRRLYWYAVAASCDGETFTLLADRGKRSKGSWFGWQVIRFPARPVKAIRLFGLNESGDRTLYAVELEAYCVPPQTMPGAAPAGGVPAKGAKPKRPPRHRNERK